MPLHEEATKINAVEAANVRRHPRYLFSIPLTLRHWPPNGFKTSHGMTLDISEGGMAALIPDDLGIGETVEVDLPLPTGLLNVLAKVRYKAPSRCGFEFIGLSSQEQRQIVVSAHQC